MGTSSHPAPPERRAPSSRIPEARTLEAPLRGLARSRRAAPLLYLEITGLDQLDGSASRAARATCMRAAAVSLRASTGSVLRRHDAVVAGPGARWFAALLVDRAVAASQRAAVSDADIGHIASRLRATVQSALDAHKLGGELPASACVRAGWTVIEPRDGDRPLTELRHALRGAAVVARLEERRALVLAAVTHELRTPLTSIIGYAERLGDGAWTNKTKRCRALAIVADEARRLARLVEGLIDVGAWEAGKLTLRRAPMPLRQIVDRARAAVAARSSDRGVRLAIRGRAIAPVDADRLLQVIVNLLDNAVRHAAEGGRVVVSLKQRSQDCTIAVEDDGRGFDAMALERFGEPFAAGSGGRVGLGLAITKTLVDAHGGTLSVEQASSGGSRVVVMLPR